MYKVSVIIPSYNRFMYLLNAIESVKTQSYKNIEIIVVNDRSNQSEYYTYDFKGVKVIHLEKNSKDVLGFPCAAYVRNVGMKVATGDYIAFLDDDDIWFSNKIELQINAMMENNCDMSCTEGLLGFGVYDPNKKYKLFNSEYHIDILKNIFKKKNSNLLDNGFPDIWDLQFLQIHNCAVTSSVVVSKKLLEKVDYMRHFRVAEDYDCWLRVLHYTKCVYVKDCCFYYDDGHGDGQLYI